MVIMFVFVQLVLVWYFTNIKYLWQKYRSVMATSSDKLKRSSNFTFSERSLLVKLAVKNKAVIENKKTDAITWRQKEEVWKKITKEFNSYSNGEPRNAKQLKNKYEALKKELEKRHSSNLKYMKGTGGGQYKPPSPPKTEEEIELLKIISLSVEGFQTKYDSDGLAGIPGQLVNTVAEKEIINFDIEDDWTSSSAALWQTPKHKALQNKKVTNNDQNEDQNQDQNVDQNVYETIEIMMVDEYEPNLKVDNNYLKKDKEEFSGNISSDCTPTIMDNKMIKDTGCINKTIKDTESIHKKSWSTRRRPIIQKKKTMTSVSAKFEDVAERKLQLIALQQQYIMAKIEQDREQHEVNMQILKLKLEKEKQA